MIRKPNRLRVGVIGLGTIGSRAAANLRAAGHQVYVWNRTPRAEPNFLGSPVEVTDLCDTLQLFVPDGAALLATVRAVAPALKPRHLVLAHPTVSPEAAREAAGIVEKTGARYLDAPFTGSRAAAGNGQLVYYVSGPEPARRDALPVLEATSKGVVVIGDAVGQAAVTKIATNLVTAAIVQTLAEALALARAAGIDPARFTEAFEHNGSRSGTSDLKLAAMIKGDHATPHFALKHMLKDARLALALAAEHGLTLPATSVITAQLYGADRRGWGDLDFAALAKNYDPAPPPAVVPPTVIPEALPPPVSLPPAAAVIAPQPMPPAAGPPAELPPPAPTPAQPPPTLGLPPVPGKILSTPVEIEGFLRDMTIPRGGLPFPPGEPSDPAGESNPSPAETSALPKNVAPPPGEIAPPPGDRAVPPEAATAGKPPEAAPPGKPASRPDEKSVPAPSLHHGPRGKHEPVALPAPPAPAPAPADADAEPSSPRPPATRRTLLSWFGRGK